MLYYIVRLNTNERALNADGKYTIITEEFSDKEIERQAWLRRWSGVEKIEVNDYHNKFGYD